MSKVKTTPRRSASSANVATLGSTWTASVSVPGGRTGSRSRRAFHPPRAARLGLCQPNRAAVASCSRDGSRSAAIRHQALASNRRPIDSAARASLAAWGASSGSEDALLVGISGGLDFRLAASQLGEPLLFSGLRGQVGQSLDGRGIGRLESDERFEGRSLGAAVATPRGHPGTHSSNLACVHPRPGKWRPGAHELVGPARGTGPSQAGVPDLRVIGPSPLAACEPVVGLFEMSDVSRQVGEGQATRGRRRAPSSSLSQATGKSC